MDTPIHKKGSVHSANSSMTYRGASVSLVCMRNGREYGISLPTRTCGEVPVPLELEGELYAPGEEHRRPLVHPMLER